MKLSHFFGMIGLVLVSMAIHAFVNGGPTAVGTLHIDGVEMTMDTEAITSTVNLFEVEATSTAEMATLGFLSTKTNDIVETDGVNAVTSPPNAPERWQGYYFDLVNDDLDYINNDIYIYRTDNKLRGGAAFVGGGLPYRG